MEGDNKEHSAEFVDEEIKKVSATDEVPNPTNSAEDEGGIDEASTEEKES